MNDNVVTEIIFVLDQSGSMECIRQETINKFNQFVDSQKHLPGKANLTLTLFNTVVRVQYRSIPIENVSHLNRETYQPRDCTALNDAVAQTISDWRNNQFIGKMTKKVPFVPAKVMINEKTGEEISVPEPTEDRRYILVILTDGLENASREHPNPEGRVMVKKLLSDLQEMEGWKVIFLGADFDVEQVATTHYSVKPNNAIRFAKTSSGVNSCFTAITDQLTGYRSMSRTQYDKD